MGLWDVHSHLLPEIDDGYLDQAGCIRMLEIYRECGIDHVVVTPHIYNPFVRTAVDRIRSTFDWAKANAERIGISLHLGSELYVADQKVLRAIPIRNRFVLVEFSLALPPSNLMEQLRKLVADGFVPIIAHVERFMWLNPKQALVHRLKEMGCLLQGNVEAVESGAALPYLEAGLLDMLATDNHGDERLPLGLVQALEQWPSVRKRMEEIW
ncbi:MAG: capsule biosynthesis protein CapC [Spirochaetales bacterium]|nr:capsule biosynthesis protein CapC [Spirochaetales bacterium]